MSELLPAGNNAAISGHAAAVELAAVSAADTIAGTPVQGIAELGEIAGAGVGIWELRGGTVTDTEVEELFVVLSGGATIEFLTESGVVDHTVEVVAGDVMRLTAGSRTRWTVTDHIRKVYIAEA